MPGLFELHEVFYAIIIVFSVTIGVYSLQEYRRSKGLILGDFWTAFFTVFMIISIASIIHILVYLGPLAYIHHEAEILALISINISVIYLIILLRRFHSRILTYLQGSFRGLSIVTYFAAIKNLFKGDVGYSVAFNMGKSFAENLYPQGKGDLKLLASLFEQKTGIKQVLINDKSSAFICTKEEVSGSDYKEITKMLEFFVRGYWGRILEFTTQGRVKVKSKVKMEEDIAEIIVNPA